QEDKNAEFLQWFERKGGVLTGVTLDYFGDMGRGLKATADIKEMDEVIFVPRSLTMTAERAEEDYPELVGIQKELHTDEIITLYLLVEKKRGILSWWHPYIAVLPDYIPVGNLFTQEEVALTEDVRVVATVRRSRQDAERAFRLARPHLEALGAGGATWEDWAWAAGVVSSRAITLQGYRMLAPAMDMINYSPQPVERESDQGKLYTKYHRLQQEGLRVFADRAFRPGDGGGGQFFEDYGDNPNSIYFEHHGFIPDENPHECAYVTVDAMHSRHNYDDPATKERKGALFKKVATSQLKVRAPPYELCLRANGVAPYFLNYYIGIWALEGERLDKCEQVVKVGGNPKHACAPEDPKLAKDRVLLSAVEDRLKQYPTTLAEDEAQLAEESNPHAVLALKYRLSQKRLLYGLRARWCGELGDHCPPQTRRHIEADTHPTHELHPHMVHPAASGEGKAGLAAALRAADLRFSAGADAARLAAAFNEWFAGQGAPANRLKVVPVPGMRLGTVATAPIAKGDLYLSVPVEAVLDYRYAKEDAFLGPLLSELGHLTGWRHDFDLVLLLLHEKFARGPASRWAPYLDTLPSLADLEAAPPPLFYDQARLDLLHGSDVQLEVMNYQDQVKEWHRKFAAALGAAGFGAGAAGFELFRWAQHILDTRSIWWGGERHLVPLLDMINCREGPDPEAIHRTDLDTSGRFADTLAPWDFEEGEEVFENYGQPNHIYFVYHGFALEENAHDCVFLSLPI
ncbi:unnamed protein product, partial [Heterosigma akashiwo]